MFARIAISMTFLLFPGSALAEWQSQAAAATPAVSNAMAPQAASGVVQTSHVQEENPIDADIQFVLRPEIEVLIREGNKRMREGDVLGARQVYQKAFASGDAAAALAMGRSYDPIYLAKIVEGNAKPEPDKAFECYQRAKDAGAPQTAGIRIDDLKQFMRK
jgi:hypothetical protein